MTGIDGLSALERAERTSLTGTLTDKEEKVGGSLFDAFLNSAINNIKTTNSYLSRAEDEELKFAMGGLNSAKDFE